MKIMFYSILSFLFFSFYSLSADNIDYFSVSAGLSDFMRPPHRTEEVRIEYRPSFNLQTFRPIFGIMGTFKGAMYLYSGIGLDLFFNKKIYFSPSFAAGLYFEGGGKDLGFPLEFRSGAELGWRFENAYRLALHICHISNASLGNKNPGCESLVLTLYTPINVRVKKHK